MTDRFLVRYTGYPGGQRHATPKEIIEKNANKLVEHSVKGMLPKSPLGNQMFRKLFVYEGAEHPHLAQKPKQLI
jgi:large subunit ribosomal protein L13